MFGVPTVNEVRCAVMYSVVMAFVAQALPIIYIVAQFRKISHRFDVMGFQILMAAAMLASEAIT